MASTDTLAIVGFRGTEITHLEDDLSDAEAKLVVWSTGGRVHQGFAGALESVWQPLQAYLASLRREAVWFTGHSLGAALATLAAVRWKSLGGDVGGVYTIGSPRVGDGEFADTFEPALSGRCFRYVNGNDGVTQNPSKRGATVTSVCNCRSAEQARRTLCSPASKPHSLITPHDGTQR